MEPTSENRFDHHYAAQILLEMAHEHSLETLLHGLVERAMERPHMACAQVWLIEKGDLYATCPRRFECPDQSRCQHLVTGKGRLPRHPGREPLPYDDLSARVLLNVAQARSRRCLWMRRHRAGEGVWL